jgi:ribosomal protein S18 acetylase RimI-like enzyme
MSTLNVSKLIEHFESCDKSYFPSLSERVVLDEYAQKIIDHGITFEAWDGERLLGVVSAYLNTPPTGFITDVSVSPSAHGKGLAKKLVSNCINVAQEKYEMRGLKLNVSAANIKALNLYQSLGFDIESESDQELAMTLKFGNTKNDQQA